MCVREFLGKGRPDRALQALIAEEEPFNQTANSHELGAPWEEGRQTEALQHGFFREGFKAPPLKNNGPNDPSEVVDVLNVARLYREASNPSVAPHAGSV